ncbi:MAG: large subunit ribosomal protein L19 [Phycisphaerales bacterium]|jgi:large subunit ribosomal protein L19
MGTQQIIESLNAEAIRTDLPVFDVGDTVNIHIRIREGEKERVQVFSGTVMLRRGRGINEMITVRRVVDDIGVERTWPLNSPSISTIEVVRRGDARRAKLYYLRDRVGKSRRMRDRRRGMKHVEGMKTVHK